MVKQEVAVTARSPLTLEIEMETWEDLKFLGGTLLLIFGLVCLFELAGGEGTHLAFTCLGLGALLGGLFLIAAVVAD